MVCDGHHPAEQLGPHQENGRPPSLPWRSHWMVATRATMVNNTARCAPLNACQKTLLRMPLGPPERRSETRVPDSYRAASKAENGSQANLERQRGPRSVTLGAPSVT